MIRSLSTGDERSETEARSRQKRIATRTRSPSMTRILRKPISRLAVAAMLFVASAASVLGVATAQAVNTYDERPQTISSNELVDSGHRFFGTVSRDLALAIQEAVSRWGEPNGYILGEEGSGAFVGGLRYGEGT